MKNQQFLSNLHEIWRKSLSNEVAFGKENERKITIHDIFSASNLKSNRVLLLAQDRNCKLTPNKIEL